MAKKIPKKSVGSRQSLFLVVCGVFLALAGLGYRIHVSRNLSFAGDYKATQVKTSKEAPKFIIIKSIQVNLPVKQTRINRGVWEIFNDGASHLSSSGNPDEKRPIIVYAHNKSNQFGNLKSLKKGDTVVLSSGKNHYLYVVDRSLVTDPTNLNALRKAKGETLVLYTCTGFADSKRLLVYANRLQ